MVWLFHCAFCLCQRMICATLQRMNLSFEKSQSYRTGLILGAVGAVLFSAKAIIVKLIYRYGVDAETVLALRMGLSLPFFIAIALWQQRRQPLRMSRLQWGRLVLVGLLGYYAASYLDFLGLQYISAALERLILFLYPTLVLLFARLFFKRGIQTRQWWALAVSYLGIALAFAHDVSLQQPALFLGAALVLASAFVYALYLLLGGELSQQLGTLRMTALASCVAVVASEVQFFVMRDLSALSLSWQVYALSGFNAVFCTVIPVFCVMFSIERVGAGVASQIGMLGPISTLLLAALLLGETITLWHLAGTALVLVGVLMLGQSKGKE